MGVIVKTGINFFKALLPIIAVCILIAMFFNLKLINEMQEEYKHTKNLSIQLNHFKSILIGGLMSNSSLGVIIYDGERKDVKDTLNKSIKKVYEFVKKEKKLKNTMYGYYDEEYDAFYIYINSIYQKVLTKQTITKEDFETSIKHWKKFKLKLIKVTNLILKEQTASSKRYDNYMKSLLTKVGIIMLLILTLLISFVLIINRFKKLNQDLYFDPLTGLQNRNALVKNIKTYNAKGVMILDILHFSKINDVYGEKIGDKVLTKVSRIIRGIAKKECTIHRLGADQFALLNTKNHPLEYCMENGKRIVSEIAKTPITISVDGEDIDIHLNVVIGLARNDKGKNIIENADMALRFAKNKKEPMVVYSDDLGIKQHYSDDIKATKLVKKALQEDRIVPFFQPILKNDTITYECLVRIIERDGKVIPPSEYLDIIKNTQYYTELTKVMITKSIEMFKDKDHQFSINISFHDISNEELVKFLVEKITTNNIGDKVILEIVESEAIEDFELIKSFINDMKKLNIQIAIDDFGTGYSNFSHLLDLNPDFIKIDGSLIKNIDTDKKSYTISKTIANFSKDMDIKVIAEYIHSEEVYNVSKEIGFDGYQGYLLGAPKQELK
jgi:diguanylate cyclase (GGDEF)-like protein